MECPNPHCEGQLILTRLISSVLGTGGEVPEVDIKEAEDYIVCTECGESPGYTWAGEKIVLAECRCIGISSMQGCPVHDTRKEN